MMTVEQIKKRLEDANLKRVAENAGVHPATVYRFMQDESKPSPRQPVDSGWVSKMLKRAVNRS